MHSLGDSEESGLPPRVTSSEESLVDGKAKPGAKPKPAPKPGAKPKQKSKASRKHKTDPDHNPITGNEDDSEDDHGLDGLDELLGAAGTGDGNGSKPNKRPKVTKKPACVKRPAKSKAAFFIFIYDS